MERTRFGEETIRDGEGRRRQRRGEEGWDEKRRGREGMGEGRDTGGERGVPRPVGGVGKRSEGKGDGTLCTCWPKKQGVLNA